MRLRVIWKNGWAHLDGVGPDGKRVRRSLKTQDATQAEEARAQLEARLWKEGLYGPEAIVTFEQAALAYAEDGGETRFLLPVSEHFKGKLLRNITPNDIREASKVIYPNAKASTRNRQVVAPASAVINFGHQQGWCSPIRVKRLKEDKPVRKAVGFEYLEALKAETPPHLWAMLFFMHTTGRRISEAVNLQADDVDLAARTATIRKTKNGDPIRVSLPKVTADAMRAVAPASGPFFRYLVTKGARDTLKRACKRAGVEYIGTHQIGRHSFATHLKTAGIDSKTVADAGGWKTTKIVDDIYTHLPEASTRASRVIDTISAKSKKRKA